MATRGPAKKKHKPKQDPPLRRTGEDTPTRKHTHTTGLRHARRHSGQLPGDRVILTLLGWVGGVQLVVCGGWDIGRLLLTEETAQASSESSSGNPHTPERSPLLLIHRLLL